MDNVNNEFENELISSFNDFKIIELINDDMFEDSIFSIAYDHIEKERKGIVSDILGACPALAEIVHGLKTEEYVKLIFSDEMRKGIEEGVLKLMPKKGSTGLLKAVVVDQNGVIRGMPDIAFDNKLIGINPAQMATAMQGIAIQQQLKDISEQLEMMSMALNDVLAGQHNDRLAKYYAGVSLYKESLSVKDELLKNNLKNSALLMLSDAYSELSLSLRYDVDKLTSFYNERDNSFRKIKYEQLIQDVAKINQSFEAIHRAVSLKTAIYFNEGEYNACVTVLNEYGAYLQKILTQKKAEILFQADPKAKSFIGVWNDRKEVLPQKIKEVQLRLQNKAEYGINIKMEDGLWNIINVQNAVN